MVRKVVDLRSEADRFEVARGQIVDEAGRNRGAVDSSAVGTAAVAAAADGEEYTPLVVGTLHHSQRSAVALVRTLPLLVVGHTDHIEAFDSLQHRHIEDNSPAVAAGIVVGIGGWDQRSPAGRSDRPEVVAAAVGEHP